MTIDYVMSLAQNAMTLTVMLVGPVLVVSLVIGVLVSMIQAATQINEATLTFIPKMVGIGLVLIILGSWMLQQLVSFTSSIISSLPSFVP